MENQDHREMVNSTGKVWAGLIIVIVGALLFLDNVGIDLPSWIFYWSNILIVVGIFTGVKHNFKNGSGIILIPETDPNPKAEKRANEQDYLDSVNVFGGSNQIVYSKNFKGGEITAIFGGCDVNLTQADFEGQVVIDVTAIFGGTKIIVPQGWIIKSEVTAVFGGLDDKRGIMPMADGQNKLLIIKGVALFGGVDIRSY